MRSNALELELAFQRPQEPIHLGDIPTPAQFGALLCHADASRITNVADWAETSHSRPGALADAWFEESAQVWDLLATTIDAWAISADKDAGISLGYWLTAMRLRGVSARRVTQLTRFLAEPVFPRHPQKTKSVRRYPTGGISEKQAILLPAILRLLSEPANLNSSFLVARRLGHTGGTSDKLRILPGFSLTSAGDVNAWDGTPPSVRYFTAGRDFCPRDEVLYFLRGETGTVRQVGLIVASIIAKQFALQADLTLLDVLYGPGAFFHTREEADAFVALASAVCAELPLSIDMALRPTSRVPWHSIGNATEIGEVLTLLDAPTSGPIPEPSELALAASFATHLARGPALSDDEIQSTIETAWRDGTLRENLLLLWAEHGVPAPFLTEVRYAGAEAILDKLRFTEIVALATGTVTSKDVVELADMVNNRLNHYLPGPGGLPLAPGSGGIMLGVPLGSLVERGQPLMRVYASEAPDPQLLQDLADNLEIAEPER